MRKKRSAVSDRPTANSNSSAVLRSYWTAAREPERRRALDLLRAADVTHNLVTLCSGLSALGISNPAALELLTAMLPGLRAQGITALAATLISQVRVTIEGLANSD